MDAAWLKQNVGEALTAAMADCARKQPEDPVSFLGRHLVQFVDAAERAEREAQLETEAAERARCEEQVRAAAEAQAEAEQKEREAAPVAIQTELDTLAQPLEVAFSETDHGKSSFVSVADHLDVLAREKLAASVDFFYRNSSAEAVYLAKVNSDGSLAFVSSSDPAIQGQVLAKSEDEDGKAALLPFDVLVPDEVPEADEEEEDADPAAESEGAEPKPIKLPKFVHVPNMLRDSRVPFFGRIPTLGSFVAVHVPYKCSVHKDAIPEDGGLIVPEPANDEPTEGDEENADGTADENPDESVEAAGSDGSAGVAGTEDGEDPEAEASEAQAEPPKRWRANTIDASYVLCFDTMGSDSFVEGVPENEIELARKLAYKIGEALTATEDSRYQAEMQLRDKLASEDEAAKETATATLTAADEDAAAAAEKVRSEAAEAAAAAETAAAEAAAAAAENENEGEGEGEGAAETVEPSPSLESLEEAIAFREAHSKLSALQEGLAVQEWWQDHLRTYIKLCIEPEDHVQQALHLFLRVFAAGFRAAEELTWAAVKAQEHAAWLVAPAQFDPTEPGSEASCGLDAATAAALLEETQALTTEEPAWIPALHKLAVGALESVVARAAHLAKLEEIEAARIAAEEEAAAAAAAAAAAEAEAEAAAAAEEEA